LTRAVPWWIRARGCRRNRGGSCTLITARQGGRTDGSALDSIRKRACRETASRGRAMRGTGLRRCSSDVRGRDRGEARRRRGGAAAAAGTSNAAGAGRAAGEGCERSVVGVDAAAQKWRLDSMSVSPRKGDVLLRRAPKPQHWSRTNAGVGASIGAGDGLGRRENRERERGQTHRYPADTRRIEGTTHTILVVRRRSLVPSRTRDEMRIRICAEQVRLGGSKTSERRYTTGK
jgi:hypothetical protein